MKKVLKCILIILTASVILLGIAIFSNPLRKSEEKIKKDILELTPIGTSMEEVIEMIETKEKWEVRYISYDHGYPDRRTKTGSVGEKSIRVFIGEYTNIFTTSVTVFWGFDEDSKLINVYVWKDMDSL